MIAHLILYLEFGASETVHAGGGWLLGVVQQASRPQLGAELEERGRWLSGRWTRSERCSWDGRGAVLGLVDRLRQSYCALS